MALSSSILEKIVVMKKNIEDIRLQYLDESKRVLSEGVSEIFNLYPSLEKFSWRQYTPYFNDGDTCEFSAHTESASLVFNNLPEGYENENEDEYYDGTRWSAQYELKELEKRAVREAEPPKELEFVRMKLQAANDVVELLNAIGEDNLEIIFGDHVEVIISRDAIVTEEYEHD